MLKRYDPERVSHSEDWGTPPGLIVVVLILSVGCHPASRGTTVGSPRWGSFLSTRYHRPAHRTGGSYYFTYKTGDLESYPKDFFFRRKEIKRY